MPGKTKGITIEFRGDTTSLDKAMRKINSESKDLNKRLKDVDKALKFNPKNTELLAQKQTLLKEKVKQTEQSLKDFKKLQDQLDAKGIEKTSKEYMEVRRNIIEAESKLKHFNQEIYKLGNAKLNAVFTQLQEIADKMAPVGEAMTKYVTGPIAAAGTAAVASGLDFDSAMSQVAATMGTTTDQIQELRDFALEMGSTTAFSATEAAQALNYMALAGYDAEESMTMLPTVLNLAAAGNMDLARASDVVTDAQTALGLSLEETQVLVDQMAKTASSSNTSVEQLGEAILTVGGTARNMHGGIEELNAVLGALADNGIKGSEGGTALRNMLLKLSDPTSKTADALDKLGIQAYDADGKFRDLRDLFPEIAAGLDTLSDAEKNDILGDMFNVRDISKANALLNTSVERWDELSTAIENAGGSAEQMASTQLDNLKGDLTLLKSALEGAAIAVSDVLAPGLRKLTDFITGLVDKFNALDEGTQKTIVTVLGIAAAIGPAILVLTKIISGVSIAIKAVSTAMTFLAANPIVLIIAAIAAVIAIIVAVITHFDEVKAKATEIWEHVKSVFGKVADFFAGLWDKVKGAFVTFATNIGEAISGAVKNAINGVIAYIENTINKAIRLINGAIGLINKLPGVNIGTIGEVNLPRLAKGGVLYGAQTVIAGEAGPEAIIPLDKLFRQMDRMTEQITGAGGGGININVYAAAGTDLNELARQIEQRLVEAQKRRRLAWQ